MARRAAKRRNQPLRETIRDEIRAMIHTGELEPNKLISERDLAEKLRSGGSRTPISQGIQALAAEGLLSHEASVGARVARFTEHDAARLLKLRELIELFLARELASRSVVDLAPLVQIVKHQAESIDPTRPRTFLSLGSDFHLALTRLAGYELIEDIVQQLWSRSTAAYAQRLRSRALDTKMNLDDMKSIANEHKAIVDALSTELEEERIIAVENAVKQHFSRIRERAGVQPG